MAKRLLQFTEQPFFYAVWIASTILPGRGGGLLPLFGDGLVQMPVQAVGEVLPVALAVGRRAAGVDAAAAQFVHEGAHRQHLRDVVGGVEIAARIERIAAFFQHVGRQRDIAGDDQSPGRSRRTISWSATSAPDGTCTARTKRDGGTRIS